jgi:hypothetical protein
MQRSVGASGDFVVGNGWRPARLCAAATAFLHRGGPKRTDEEIKSGCSSSVVLEKQKNGETSGARNSFGGTTGGGWKKDVFDAVRRTETCAVAGGLTRMCRRRRGSNLAECYTVVGDRSSNCRTTVQ